MQPLVILTGPTAVGKTALSLKLARRVDGEIISADSMQVYRGMDIGTAKIKADEMQGIRHHLIDVLEPDEAFNVAVFKHLAKACVKDVAQRGKIPIIAGGTGFYIQALLYDVDFQEEDKGGDDKRLHLPGGLPVGQNAAKTGGSGGSAYRQGLEALEREKGPGYLHDLLMQADPKAAEAIHANNRKRIIRALEFFHLTGGLISAHNEKERKRESPYRFAYFVLDDEREKIYASINRRVDSMIAAGLIDEVRDLKNRGMNREMVAMQGLGYKEIFAYLDGELSAADAITLIKRDTRHFAKRQLTWFRRERGVVWLDKGDFGNDEALADEMVRVMEARRIMG
jgi:tRNA dimethylallyltransferase